MKFPNGMKKREFDNYPWSTATRFLSTNDPEKKYRKIKLLDLTKRLVKSKNDSIVAFPRDIIGLRKSKRKKK